MVIWARNPKDLVKTHGNEGLERVKDARGNETG